jgi:hypothetical protein
MWWHGKVAGEFVEFLPNLYAGTGPYGLGNKAIRDRGRIHMSIPYL